MTGSTGPADARPDPSSDEVGRLSAENTRLTDATASAGPTERRGRWRPVVAGLLVAAAAFLAPLSVLSTWASSQIQDTDRYLATVGPLAREEAVQDAVAARLEQVIFTYLDLDTAMDELVAALTPRRLPAAADATVTALTGPLTAGIRTFVTDRIDDFVQSEEFEQAWIEANRTAHKELAAALTGQGGGAVELDRGAVGVNLATFINAVKQRLVAAGFTIANRIPDVAASFTIIESEHLGRVQALLGVLDDLSTWLPMASLALLGAAVTIARDRRRMVLAFGLAVAGSMLLLGGALNAIRPLYLEALPEGISPAAAGAVYDQVVSFIRTALRSVLVLALTVAVVAWLSARCGPGFSARSGLVKGFAQRGRGTAPAGLRTGRLGAVLGQYRGPLRAAIAGLAALLYLAQDNPSRETALTFVLVTVVLLLVLAVLATDPAVESETPVPAATPTG